MISYRTGAQPFPPADCVSRQARQPTLGRHGLYLELNGEPAKMVRMAAVYFLR